MSERDDVFRKFGPILLEAMCWVLLDFQNELRRNQGMQELAMQDIFAALSNHLEELDPYSWMQSEN